MSRSNPEAAVARMHLAIQSSEAVCRWAVEDCSEPRMDPSEEDHAATSDVDACSVPARLAPGLDLRWGSTDVPSAAGSVRLGAPEGCSGPRGRRGVGRGMKGGGTVRAGGSRGRSGLALGLGVCRRPASFANARAVRADTQHTAADTRLTGHAGRRRRESVYLSTRVVYIYYIVASRLSTAPPARFHTSPHTVSGSG